jgi:hypothetical protein
MPRRSSSYRTPREWLEDGTWPEGTFGPDSPTAVAYAAEIARRLERGMGDRSRAGIAREANLERSTVYDLLSGGAAGRMRSRSPSSSRSCRCGSGPIILFRP